MALRAGASFAGGEAAPIVVETGGSGDGAVLEGAARDLESELGVAHPQTVRAKNALARLAAKPPL